MAWGRRCTLSTVSSLLFVIRAPAVVLLTLVTGLFLLIASPATLFWIRPRIACRRWAMSAWGRSVLWVCGESVEIVGQVPPSPYFLVCNHVSTADIFVLAAATGGRFVGKAELGGWPLVGRIISGIGTILIDRSRRTAVGQVNQVISEAMGNGENILLFLEGGICPGDRLHPFQPSLLQPAVSLERPVHYALLHYTSPAGAAPPTETITWPSDRSALTHFRGLFGLWRCHARLTISEQPIWAPDRKQLAQELREAMEPLFEPLA